MPGVARAAAEIIPEGHFEQPIMGLLSRKHQSKKFWEGSHRIGGLTAPGAA